MFSSLSGVGGCAQVLCLPLLCILLHYDLNMIISNFDEEINNVLIKWLLKEWNNTCENCDLSLEHLQELTTKYIIRTTLNLRWRQLPAWWHEILQIGGNSGSGYLAGIRLLQWWLCWYQRARMDLDMMVSWQSSLSHINLGHDRFRKMLPQWGVDG